MASQAPPLNVLFFPLMAPGHMLPMLDMAKLFAARGVISTILTTYANAPLLWPSIGTHVQLRLIAFPSGTGLPEGCENLSKVPKQELEVNFFRSLGLLRQPFNAVLTELQPDCVVTDGFLPWTYDVAADHGIPRLVFDGTNLFACCVYDSMHRFKPYEHVAPDAESFIIPGLPHRIEVLKSQLPDVRKLDKIFLEMFGQMKETVPKSYGMVANSFHELEPEYCRHYREVIGTRLWCVGPVSMCSSDIKDRLVRGNKGSSKHDKYMNWLDSKGPGSVVYVSFGTLCIFSGDQIGQLALALENCGHPFVWVVGKGDDASLEGYEERINGRGLIVRGWAPQVAILNHAAIGGFVTHCGWNSSLEGISAGLPLVTWPLFAEQFYNEKFIVEVLKIGVSIGVKEYAVLQEERHVIEAGEIEKAVSRLMDNGDEAEERRRRARELGEMAKRAMEKDGSSYENLSDLIRELTKSRETVIKGHD